MPTTDVRPLTAEEWPIAGAIAARAMRSNPGFVWMLGDDDLARASTLFDFMSGAAEDAVAVGAFRGQLLVGCARMAREGGCLGARANVFGEPPPMTGPEPELQHRVLHSMRSIAEHDPEWPHWHVGPVAIEPGFQGRGIGHEVMAPLLARMDEDGIPGWLETDKPENVRFYEAHGFEVADHVELYGSESWYLGRA